MHKTSTWSKCANVGLPFVIIKYLVLRGLHIFYVLLGPILVLDQFKKRLVQTSPRTMQDQSRPVLSGPVLVCQYSEIFQDRSGPSEPPPPSSNSRCSVSADLCNSILGDYYADPDAYGNNTPKDGPGDDPRDDPVDDDDNEDNEDWIDTKGDLDPNMAIHNNLTVAVSCLSRSMHQNNELSSSQVKVWDLDTFNGTDLKKLQTFFVQCELIYSDHPKAFHLDRSKITFTQSYLKGMALEWFKLDLLNTGDLANCPCWMDNWIAFIAELQSTFGLHNPVADAEHQLNHLQMKDGHHVTWYIMDFN